MLLYFTVCLSVFLACAFGCRVGCASANQAGGKWAYKQAEGDCVFVKTGVDDKARHPFVLVHDTHLLEVAVLVSVLPQEGLHRQLQAHKLDEHLGQTVQRLVDLESAEVGYNHCVGVGVAVAALNGVVHDDGAVEVAVEKAQILAGVSRTPPQRAVVPARLVPLLVPVDALRDVVQVRVQVRKNAGAVRLRRRSPHDDLAVQRPEAPQELLAAGAEAQVGLVSPGVDQGLVEVQHHGVHVRPVGVVARLHRPQQRSPVRDALRPPPQVRLVTPLLRGRQQPFRDALCVLLLLRHLLPPRPLPQQLLPTQVVLLPPPQQLPRVLPDGRPHAAPHGPR
eukprot:Rhum_TRINITY_DN14705_c0_g1::Rhum_TRINITY_DN14705_c0_g1_i1::g.112158::m.112158